MTKLLSAGFSRMIKNKVLWTGMAAFALLGIFMPVYGLGRETSLENVLFIFVLFTGFAGAAFCSLFIGREYSDGTIRNKLIVGQSRSSVYLSNFIISSAAGLIMNFSYIIAASAVGIPLLGPPASGAQYTLSLLFASIMMTLAFTAIFTLLGMLNQNKAVVAVISIIGVVIILVLASFISSKLDEPELIPDIDSVYYSDVVSDGVSVFIPSSENIKHIPNPAYLQGTARAVYQFIYDFLPAGQALQLFNMSVQNLWRLPLYSLIILLAANFIGVFFFRRKDLS